ncbi:hypothetical protein AURDEDRAFT_186777 [Auricularia subglabra TFB-10046 SS5]|uniref:F-box domain-containing protein n=1 Tax=Auricularia subglabra (strain TFB-10046 / SS5) TaxID=717982 RepID=J0WX28_AURST|nr:hypothetical protein AURDEDRAFT_186777 [Auricularia subglabra TFB-10046 SS5]
MQEVWPFNRWTRPSALLRRSHPDPVEARIALDFSPLERDAALDVLGTALSRAERLILFAYKEFTVQSLGIPYYTMDPPSANDWSAISSVLCQGAPFLRTFQLSRRETGTYGMQPEYWGVLSTPLSPNIFAGQPSNLRTCCLRDVNLPPGGCNALSMLTTFDYQPVDRRLCSGQLVDILSQMPRLEVLGLTLLEFEDDTDWAHFSHPFLARVSTRILHSALDIGPHLLPLLTHLGAPSLHAFDLEYIELWEWPALLALYGYPNVLRVSSDTWSQVFDVQLESQHQFWARSNWPIGTGYLPPCMFERLTSFIVHSSMWDIDEVLPYAPVLSHLQIVLPTEAWFYGSDTTDFSGFFWRVGPDQSPWYCPALERLDFSYLRPGGDCEPAFPMRASVGGYLNHDHCACTGHGTISLSDIASFIRTALKFDAPRLRAVHLYGMSAIVDPDPAAALITLQSLTDSIEAFRCTSPDARGMFDLENSFLVPPARHFDPSVPSSSSFEDM